MSDPDIRKYSIALWVAGVLLFICAVWLIVLNVNHWFAIQERDAWYAANERNWEQLRVCEARNKSPARRPTDVTPGHVTAPRETPPETSACTVERAKRESPDDLAALEHEIGQSTTEFNWWTDTLRSAFARADQIPSSPSRNIPALPSGGVKINVWGGIGGTIVAKPDGTACRFEREGTKEVEHTEPLDSWQRLFALAGVAFDAKMTWSDWDEAVDRSVPRKLGEYERQVALLTGGYFLDVLNVGFENPKGEDNEETLRTSLVAVFENELSLMPLAKWAVPLAPLLVKSQERAQGWIRDFWKASHADLPALEQKIQPAEGEEYNSHLYGEHKKLEGWFLRRWISAGRGAAGRDRMIMYRFWLWRLAQEFEMPEAREWMKELRRNLSGTNLTYQEWYLKQLK